MPSNMEMTANSFRFERKFAVTELSAPQIESLIQLQLASQQMSEASSMVNYLGKTVGSDIPVAALQNGQASWGYNLGTSSAEVNIDIYDQNGVKVKSETLTSISAGDQNYVWNGIKSNGQLAQDGIYTMTISATTAGGNNVVTTHNFKGVATGVESENGVPVLEVNGISLPISNVLSVHLTEDSEPTT